MLRMRLKLKSSLYQKYHKTPFPFRRPQFNNPTPSLQYSFYHKKCQVHVGGVIMVFQMSYWSFVLLIMYITVHV